MNTATDTPTVVLPSLDPTVSATFAVTQTRVFASEWRKFRTLRSSWILLVLAVGAVTTVGVAVCGASVTDPHELDHIDPLFDALSGFELAQLFIGVLGILLVAGEYSTGMIRATLTAVPKRLPTLWAKTAVMALVTFVTTVPAALTAFFVSQRVLSTQHLQTSWSAPNVPRSVIGVALYLTVVAIFGVGLGALVRNIAGAIATFVGIMLVLPAIASALPLTWANRINRFLPPNAGQAILGVTADTKVMTPWNGFALFATYAAVTIAAAAILLRRRDA